MVFCRRTDSRYFNIRNNGYYKQPDKNQKPSFFNNAGFMAKVYEFQSEGGSRFLYNKITIGVKEIANEYLSYFSPNFFPMTVMQTIGLVFPEYRQ